MINLNECVDERTSQKFLKIFYDMAYKDGYKSNNSIGIWNLIIKQGIQFEKALDVGCGIGAGIKMCRKKGLNVWGCDLADIRKQWKENGIAQYCETADAKKMSYKDGEFDLVVCTDVLEHIPQWDIPHTLKEIYRVGNDKFFFSIALHQERHPFKGIYTHITLKSAMHWVKFMERAGFMIEETKEQTFHFLIRAKK